MNGIIIAITTLSIIPVAHVIFLTLGFIPAAFGIIAMVGLTIELIARTGHTENPQTTISEFSEGDN